MRIAIAQSVATLLRRINDYGPLAAPATICQHRPTYETNSNMNSNQVLMRGCYFIPLVGSYLTRFGNQCQAETDHRT